MRFAIAMPRPVPLVLVVKNGSKIRRRCSGLRPGPLSRTATHTAGRSVDFRLGAADFDPDRVGAGGQGVFQDVAKDLFEAELVHRAVQVHAGGLFPKGGVPALPLEGQVLPRLPPDGGQVPDLAFQLEGARVAAHLLVEMLQVVLGLLDAGDEVQRLRPVLHLPGEHLQARLAAGQGVAALVGQAGHHLADGRQPFVLQGLFLESGDLGLRRFRSAKLASRLRIRSGLIGLVM